MKVNEYSLPDKFMNASIHIEFNSKDNLRGKIVDAQLPYYIHVKLGEVESVVPWTSIMRLWLDKTRKQVKEEAKTVKEQPKEVPPEAKAASVIDWNPDNIDWQERQTKAGKDYLEAPQNDANVDFKNLRECIRTVTYKGKKYLYSGDWSYRIIDNGNIQRFKRDRNFRR